MAFSDTLLREVALHVFGFLHNLSYRSFSECCLGLHSFPQMQYIRKFSNSRPVRNTFPQTTMIRTCLTLVLASGAFAGYLRNGYPPGHGAVYGSSLGGYSAAAPGSYVLEAPAGYAASGYSVAGPAVASYGGVPAVAGPALASYGGVPAVSGYHGVPAVSVGGRAPVYSVDPSYGYGYGVGNLGYGPGTYGYGHGLSGYGLNYGYGLGSASDYSTLLRKKK